MQVESGRIVSELAAHDASVESAAFCDCMPLAASAAMDNRLCVWDLGSYTLRHTCVHPAGVVELRWRRDSPLLVSCAVSRELRLWDARNGACLNVLTGHCDAVLCIDLGYTEHGMYVVSGADDHSARLWALDV
jgi:ribosome assembly protein SQT1